MVASTCGRCHYVEATPITCGGGLGLPMDVRREALTPIRQSARRRRAPTIRTAARLWLRPGVLPGVYEPRSTAGTVLHQVVRRHLERFLAETTAATDGVGVPRFIEREFRDFLGYGVLGRGFARVRCDACRFERLVPFSCKGRAVCPSCGGRRMAEQAAHLVDDVLPFVPVRQWVLTVPHRLRYRLAFDHALIRAVLGWYRRRGRRAGVPDGQSGTVTVVQRFGSELELNVHFLVAPLLRSVVEAKRLHAAGRWRRLQELLLKEPAQEVGSPLPPF